MRPTRRVLALATCLLGLAGLGVYFGCLQVRDLKPDRTHATSDLREPSGLVWLPGSERLLVVCDEFEVAEVSIGGAVIRRRPSHRRDLEGVALCPGHREALVVDERTPALIRLSLRDLTLNEEVRLPLIPEARHANRSYEGLAILEGDRRILLLNQDPPALVEVLVDWTKKEATIARTVLIDAPNASDLLLSPDGKEAVVLSSTKGLRLFTVEGKPLGSWLALAPRRLEGITLVADVGLVLAGDRQRGAIHIYEAFSSWKRLREALARS